VNKDLLSSFSVASRNTYVIILSHLLFVDDTLIFVGLISSIFVICGVPYVLKLFQG